jgi:hypothetical protein
MVGMNEFEPVLLTQFDNDFLIGIANDPENAIDALSRDRSGKRFQHLHGDLHLIDRQISPVTQLMSRAMAALSRHAAVKRSVDAFPGMIFWVSATTLGIRNYEVSH